MSNPFLSQYPGEGRSRELTLGLSYSTTPTNLTAVKPDYNVIILVSFSEQTTYHSTEGLIQPDDVSHQCPLLRNSQLLDT